MKPTDGFWHIQLLQFNDTYEMKIKQSTHSLVFGLCILLFFIMSLMTIALYIEYQFFKQQALRMLELQRNYQEFVYSLKQRYILKKSLVNDVDSQEDNFENSLLDGGSEFKLNPVNREVLYLRSGALGFGKAHNLEKVVKPLYEGGTWDTNYSSVIRSYLEPKSQPNQNRSSYARRGSLSPNYLYDFSLNWPINKKQFWISSRFGPRKKRFHYGIDMAALKGTPVYAAAEGTVVEVSFTPKGYGKSIVISHQKCKTRYAHLDEILVKVGQKVTPSKQIGCVGATGLVRGKNDASHLHFEVVDLFGKRINPLYILR